MTLEKILGYFGTYTAGVDGAVSSFQFEYLTSLGFAAIVIFLGHAIVKRSALLKKFAIPAPVVSGLLFSIAVAILKASGVMAFSFDVKTIQDLCQNIFFMCVGFGFSWKLIRHAGGKLCIMIAVAACLLITLQDVLGVLVGNLIGMDPYLALQCSSASMSGAPPPLSAPSSSIGVPLSPPPPWASPPAPWATSWAPSSAALWLRSLSAATT